MEREIRYQRDADPEWTRHILKQPGCEKLLSCIQCGTCSGACPLSIYMDYAPRRVIGLVREGFKKDALKSKTIWLCASCYACAAECPQQIKITDIMYTLKREAIKNNMYPKRFPASVLSKEFYRMIRGHGRNSELWLIVLTALKSNPLILMPQMGLGWHLLRTGRLSLKFENIQKLNELKNTLKDPKEVL